MEGSDDLEGCSCVVFLQNNPNLTKLELSYLSVESSEEIWDYLNEHPHALKTVRINDCVKYF
jgi:hypothetical protein